MSYVHMCQAVAAPLYHFVVYRGFSLPRSNDWDLRNV